jgi:hypothetical protein
MDENEPRKGVITKLFGVVLVFVGALDSLLSWRGGLVVNDFYLALIGLGVFLFAIGAIRQADDDGKRPRDDAPSPGVRDA